MPKELVKGSNPREVFRKHKERGPKRFTYTYEDLARLSGVTIDALRKRISRGAFDPNSFESVIQYLVSREIEKRAAPVG